MELLVSNVPPKSAHSQTDSVQREPLFPDDWEDDIDQIVNTMDVTRKIYAIRHLERLSERYQRQDEESRAFYLAKLRQCEERIEYIKQNILRYLQQEGLKHIQTPAGTAYQRVLTTKVWPDDDLLLAWVALHLPSAVLTASKPNRKMISDHIKTTGDRPEGYTERHETKVYLK